MGPRLEQTAGRWHVYCPNCTWNSKKLKIGFPDPDAALHVLHLHEVLCEGRNEKI